MEKLRIRYDAPEMTEMGAVMDATRGTCVCKAEESGFKPAADEPIDGTSN